MKIRLLTLALVAGLAALLASGAVAHGSSTAANPTVGLPARCVVLPGGRRPRHRHVRGLAVAVVDSGCDASHPDPADHVVHNVKLYSGGDAVADLGVNLIFAAGARFQRPTRLGQRSGRGQSRLRCSRRRSSSR